METLQIVPNPVPLPTLGVLLHQFRVGANESVETVSRRGMQDLIDVVRVEIDRTEIGLDALEHIVDSYRVPRTLFPVGRSRVVVDLVAGTVGVHVGEQDDVERQEDRILLTYLELLYDARGLDQGHALALTALHVGVLRDVLSSRGDAVQRHLEDLLDRSADDETAPLGRRLVIAALALFAAGTFLVDLRSQDRSDPAIETTPPPVAAPVVADRPAQPSTFRVVVPNGWSAAARASLQASVVEPVAGAVEAVEQTPDAAALDAMQTPETAGPAVAEIGDAVTATPDDTVAPTPPVEIAEAAMVANPDATPVSVPVEIGDAVTITRDAA